MPKLSHRKMAPVELNLTSMLDVIFLLIIFFLLVSNMSTAELPKLEPPEPESSQAREPQERSRVVINIIPPESRNGTVQRVRVGQEDIAPGNFGRLTQMLQTEKLENPNVEVDLRADLSIHYKEVQPVMNAITSAGIGKINMIALLPSGAPKQ